MLCLGAGLGLSACAGAGAPQASPSPPATIVGLGFDRSHAALRRIDLALPAASDVAAHLGRYDFTVLLDVRSSSFWNASRLPDPHDPGRVLIRLTPADLARVPTLGASLVVAAVSHDTGMESTLATGVVEKRTGGFSNVDLAEFAATETGRVAPAGWLPSGSALEDGKVAPVTIDGVRGTQISLHARRSDWNSIGVAQVLTTPEASSFAISIRPTRDCDGDSAAPREVSGVALSDSAGHLAQFCVSSKVKRLSIGQFNEGRQIIAVYPGRLRAWNRVAIDLDRVRPYFRLYGASGGTQVTLGISVHRGPKDPPIDDAIAFADIAVR